MPDERAASSRVTRATSKPRRKQRSLTKIASADRKAGRTKAPATAPAPRRTPSGPQPRASSSLKPLATPQKLAKAKIPYEKPKSKSAGLQQAVSGKSFARTLGHAVSAVGEDIVKHPVDAAQKTAKGAGEIVKGVASTAIGVPVYAAKELVDRAVPDSVLGGNKKGDSPGEIVARIAGTTAKSYKKKYGPSWKGEKGARKALAKTVEKEGPLNTALDIATVLAPASSGIGATAKLGSRVRPALKVEPLKSSSKQRSRSSAIGAAVDTAQDATRKGVQRAAVARSTQRLRTRVPGVKPRHIEGRKPGILNTEPKPLTARRAALKPGEVAPVSEKAANRTLRRRVAEDFTRGKSTGKYRVERHVTGKGPESLRAAFKDLPEDRHHVALTATQLGIKDAAGARAVLPARIAEIERSRAAAIGREGKTGKKDAAAEARAARAGDEGELPRLREYLANPTVFDDVTIQGAADAARRRVAGGREGLSPERAAQGRSALVGGTLGVKPAKELNAAAKAEHGAKVDAAQSAVNIKRAAVVKLQRSVSTGRAATREAAIGAGAAGKVRVGNTAALKSIGRNAAKQDKRTQAAARAELRAAERAHTAALKQVGEARGRGDALGTVIGGSAGAVGRRQAAEALAVAERRLETARAAAAPQRLKRVAATAEPLVRDAAGLRVAKRELQTARERAAQIRSAAPKAARESSSEYEARVAAAAAERNLAAPEYVPSKFEQEGLRSNRPSNAPANPMGPKRAGTLYRLGREDKTLDVVERGLSSALTRGASKQAEGHILGWHGIAFESEQAARDYATGLGLNTDARLGRPDVAIHAPTGGEAPKGLVSPRTSPKGKPIKDADAGDYVKTGNVFLVPRAVKEELDALNLNAATPASALQKLAHYPQAALLALSPSWFQFQRVNDAIASLLGGSLQHTVSLEKVRRGLDPDSREILHMMAGGGISSELLTPFSAQKIGRVQRVLDESKVYQKAFGGQNPATVLLRADQAVTHSVRERQLLHNLAIVARKMDPDVAAIHRAFGPLGNAFKTADLELAQRLLKEPRYAAQLEDAAQRLYKIHGDWHNYTAREQRLKHYAAFYGFLRYATRMALYTLPVQHPYVGMLIGQLGKMGAEDAKAIIGPDLPYGLSALYNKDGTIAADFARANPLLGPLFSVDKPEAITGLATPLAGITLSYLLGQPIGLSDSSEGRIKQFTVKGDPTDHAVGGFTGEPRMRIVTDQLLGLLSPYREWKRFDGRQQSSDSLAWDRRLLQSTMAGPQVRIDEKNAAAKQSAGAGGLLHNTLPLFAPGSAKNMKTIGASVTAAREAAAGDRKLNAAKRQSALHGLSALDRQLEILDAQIKANEDKSNAPLKALDDALKLIDAQIGAG